MSILLALTAILAGVNTAVQAIDLHTTIEAIKYGVGYETNSRLQFLNGDLSIGQKFWHLAVIKGLCAAIVAWILFLAWLYPDVVAACGCAQAYLLWRYWPVMRTNIAIFKTIKKGA